MEMMGGIDMPKDNDGGGGGPIALGARDGMEGIVGIVGIEGIEGTVGGPSRAELMVVGGPRFKEGMVEPREGARGAELSEHMEVEPREGPMGATGVG